MPEHHTKKMTFYLKIKQIFQKVTNDHVFIEIMKFEKKKLFYSFVDFSKA